jgi:signal transduction histidine kinase
LILFYRTPLSGIIGSIDILKFAPLTDEYSKLIDMARACSTNLLQVINDILDFSKVCSALTDDKQIH